MHSPFGRLGAERPYLEGESFVARRARAFGMEIIAHDPFVSTSVAKEQGIRLAKLEEVYAAADYLTLHVGLTPQTENEARSQAGELRARRTGR